ncbi:hypothetical protein ACO14J_000601 [Vibrio parahaemolyticus]|uniref:hypothetical protein n=1 Tax=Vibrio parahaemolyticus TaxID=670 RepID=UPI00111FE321|nr:hypothetical protein [Vibrio parahaemolyticus]MBE4288147.1 hypothetical protein [Vibrio parahaemolyticus]TOD59213.1 hypothetical protein CGJ62_02015 [Vibrio parahaemolyticus]
MRFASRTLLFFCCVAASFSSLASQRWWQEVLSSTPYQKLSEQVQHDGNWYPCDVQIGETENLGRSFCLDEFSFYQQTLYGEAVFEEKKAQFSFLSEYQRQTLSELILNLRKDGLVMRSLAIGNEQYDVAASLKNKSAGEVDKEVVLLINRYPPEIERSMVWVKADEFTEPSPHVIITLRSDGEMIELRLTRL